MSAVGVIGVGAMGLGVAQALLAKGFTVFVRDIVADRQAVAVAAGAIGCASPLDVARRAPIVITLVVDASQTDTGVNKRVSHFYCSRNKSG